MRRSVRALVIASVCAAGGLGIAAVQQATAQPGRTPLHRGFRVNADVSFRVYVPAGRVRIVAWDRDSIDIKGTIAQHAGFFGGGGGTHAKMGVEPLNPRDSTLAHADITVSVPRRARAWVKLTTGTIEATGVTGELELYAVGGSIAVQRCSGVLSVESIDASVSINGFSGALRVRNGKGLVRLGDVSGTASVASVSGSVSLMGPSAPDARVETIGGSIDVDVKRYGGSTVDLQSHSGDITVTVLGPRVPAFDLLSRGGKVSKPAVAGDAKEGRVIARSFKGAINMRTSGGIEGTR